MRIFGEEWGWRAEHQGVRLHGRQWIFTFFSAPRGSARHRELPYFILGDISGRELAIFSVGQNPDILAGQVNRRTARYGLLFAKQNRRLLELHWRLPDRWDSWTFLSAIRITPST